jgi:hypothetical protein
MSTFPLETIVKKKKKKKKKKKEKKKWGLILITYTQEI